MNVSSEGRAAIAAAIVAELKADEEHLSLPALGRIYDAAAPHIPALEREPVAFCIDAAIACENDCNERGARVMKRAAVALLRRACEDVAPIRVRPFRTVVHVDGAVHLYGYRQGVTRCNRSTWGSTVTFSDVVLTCRECAAHEATEGASCG